MITDHKSNKQDRKRGNHMKEKLVNALGALGSVIYFIVTMFIYVLPIVMIGKPFWLDSIFFGVMQFFPSTSIIFWVWGLVSAIKGPQDFFAIIYYVLFVIMFLPFFASIISSFFKK